MKEKDFKNQEINLKLGLKDKQSFEIPAQIVHRRKTNNGTEYGLKFKFFDKGIQAELNHFIDGLAKGEYQAHEESQQQKKLVLSSGAWGLGGFAGGFAAALILLGGFYILSGYKFSKKDQVIIVDASKKGIKSHDLFKSKTKGFPEKLKSQIANVLQVCQDVKGNVNKECLEKGLSEFSSKVSGAKQDIKRLEEKILNKGKKISKQEMHAFYLTLQKQKGLSDSQKRVELEHFQLKVKRAIQIPTKANKSKKKQGATQ